MEKNDTAKIFDTALGSKDPIKALLDIARDFVKEGNIERIHDVDVMLHERCLEYLRKGTKEDIDSFISCLNAFVDSEDGESLSALSKEKNYTERWDHLSELCYMVVENSDPELVYRLVEGRKNGGNLVDLLQKEGLMRFKDLAERLRISNQNLAKLVREFEREDIVERVRDRKSTFVQLGFMGRVYVAEHGSQEQNSAIRGRMRFKNLAKRLGISDQNLAKLAREFEHEDIVERVRDGKSTFVQFGFMGRVYMPEPGSQEQNNAIQVEAFPIRVSEICTFLTNPNRTHNLVIRGNNVPSSETTFGDRMRKDGYDQEIDLLDMIGNRVTPMRHLYLSLSKTTEMLPRIRNKSQNIECEQIKDNEISKT